MASFPEIIIILAILAVVFGLGSLAQFGKSAGKIPKEFKKGLAGPPKDPIDITPEEANKSVSIDPKPGTKSQRVEDAEIEEH